MPVSDPAVDGIPAALRYHGAVGATDSRSRPVLPTVVWIMIVLVVAALAFVAGVAFGRAFWRDVAWLKARR